MLNCSSTNIFLFFSRQGEVQDLFNGGIDSVVAEAAVPRILLCETIERIGRMTLAAVTTGAG